VSEVFDRGREREGAYDFLENEKVEPSAVAEAVFNATRARARGSACVFVVIDGSALTLTDETGEKGFGPVGGAKFHQSSGLRVMTGLAVARDGVPLGLIDQIYWARPPCEHISRAERTRRNRDRPFEEKENSYFIDCAKAAIRRLREDGIEPWVVIDREADDRNILLGLHRADCRFTIRGGRWDRQLWPAGTGSVSELIAREPSLGTYDLEIGRTGQRAARTVKIDVHAAQVTLRFAARGASSPEEDALRLYAVRLREKTPKGDGLEWLLYTNIPVNTAEHAKAIVESYQARWRIEEFHRTWKQGECNVEDAQLRSQQAMIKWATILAAVATRIERLKYLSRKSEKLPAATELAPEEIEALKLDQRSRETTKRRVIPKAPSIGEATRWIAELGGWIGPRNGPPGSITLARGLERLGYLVEGIALARRNPELLRRT
jgi:hypothetical protein